eukprot:1140477-Prymnesium_polylepis.2
MKSQLCNKNGWKYVQNVRASGEGLRRRLRRAFHPIIYVCCTFSDPDSDASGSVRSKEDVRGTRLRGPAGPFSNPVHITGRDPPKPTPRPPFGGIGGACVVRRK